jgi:hypothetical protein
MMPCGLVDWQKLFGRTSYVHVQSRIIVFFLEDDDTYVLRKCCYLFTKLRSAPEQGNIKKINKAEKTKYMLLSRHQNAGQNHDVKVGNRSFENVAHLKHLGTTVTYQNLIQEESNRRLNSGNSWYIHSPELFVYSSDV